MSADDHPPRQWQHDVGNWGLDRINQASLPLDGKYSYLTTGSGVEVHIFDTGVKPNHNEFRYEFRRHFFLPYRTRVKCGFNAYEGEESCFEGAGHGTHVAGIVGGLEHGVAKQATLMSVKVLSGENGEGSYADVIAGLNYVARRKRLNPDTPMVANLSLSGPRSGLLNRAIAATVAQGVVVVVSAGNLNGDACSKSPASAAEAITVAASDRNDVRADFSGRGPCVDLFAPGVGILAAYEPVPLAYLSGDSMAAPHVAGAAALYLQDYPNATPAQVRSAILDSANFDMIRNPSGAPNILVSTADLVQPHVCTMSFRPCDYDTDCCSGNCRRRGCAFTFSWN